MSRLSLIHVIKWFCVALIASISGVLVTYSFMFLLEKGSNFLINTTIPYYFFPVVAALISGFIIYKLRPTSAGEGIPSYLRAVNLKKGNFSATTSIYKYFAALITLVCGGSGGIVGPLVKINAGIMSRAGWLLQKIGFNEDDRRTIVICGASAVCAIVFRSPVGAGLFAVEILKRANMRYLDLFPSIITSCLTIALITMLDLPLIYQFKAGVSFAIKDSIFWICIIGIFTGFYSIVYVKFYEFIRKVMGRDCVKVRNMVFATIFVGFVAYLVDQNLLSISLLYFQKLVEGSTDWPFANHFPGKSICLVLLGLAVLKGLTNCVTVGSGLSAGFTGPSVIMGLFIGAAFAAVLGIEPGSGTYYVFLASGLSGILSSSMNVPLAAAVMGGEIFGPAYALPTAISSILAFQVARSSSLYDFQYLKDK